ncbi:cytochrome c551 [Aneurinibacillus soli]|uniref:Cytochrome c-551 n=1 Tax=Aneurinibacillus soli TaxID=1500254 RepID=A0A0U5AYR6_9BACL|nr:cytochrome c [Aneurinibacillus soli]PYE63657.1 cytochrome c551 [Aneurinibacillus soli]BAU27410.1 Cytochrome c-551 precursor [Aneurinibacillus soli]
MKKMATAGVLLMLALGMTACGGQTAKKPISSDDEVKAALQSRCVMCHGAELKGTGPNPDLTTVGSRLSKEQIKEVLQKGRNGMPGGLVKPEELEVVASYLAKQK